MSEEIKHEKVPANDTSAKIISTFANSPGEEEYIENLARLSAGSRFHVIKEKGDEPPKKQEPAIDLSEETLKAMVGKVFIYPSGVYVGAKYTVKDLTWSKKAPRFLVLRDGSAPLEFQISCEEFLRTREEHHPPPPPPTLKPPPTKTKTPWSSKDGPNSTAKAGA